MDYKLITDLIAPQTLQETTSYILKYGTQQKQIRN